MALSWSAFAAETDETLAAFREQISAAQADVAACAAKASDCRPEVVPKDARVQAEGEFAAFHVDWQWLREALGSAQKGSAQKRGEAMRGAGEHLRELASEVDAPAGRMNAAAFAKVRNAANAVLARDEFRAAEGPSWLDRQIARVEDWIARAFMGMEGIGARNPWLAPLIEWGCFGLAAGGLVFFVRRSLARQMLRIALSEGAVAARRSDRDATDWARLAEERAAAGDWRDGVHCLYWAAVVSLEARQAWRPNPTRTPREYLRLMRPGSEAQQLMRELTALLERAWYGHGEVSEAEYRAARSSFGRIKTADLARPARVGAEFAGQAPSAGAA